MKKVAGKRSVSFDDEEAGAGLVVGLPVPGGPTMPAQKRRSWVLAVAVPLALVAVLTVATVGGVLAGQGGGGLTEPAGRATLDREHVDGAVFLDFAADHPEFAPVGHAGRGYCGVSADGERALDSIVDFSGQVVPPRGLPPQATLTAGEEIDLKFKLTDVALRDVSGRVEVGVCCKDPAGASDREMQACFDHHRFAAPLAADARTTQIRAVRTEEVDADGDGGAVEGSLRWRLPAAVAGERCLLQWRLFPANAAAPALVDCADVTIRARPLPEDEDAAREGVVTVGRPAANNGTELSADVLDTVSGDEWSSIAVADWAQCGGLNSLCQEDKACLSCESAGWTCQRGNEWWWQCRKAVAGPDATDSGETKPGQKPAAVGDWQACGGKNTAGCSADEDCFACASAAYRCRRDSEWYWQCRPGTAGRRNRLRA